MDTTNIKRNAESGFYLIPEHMHEGVLNYLIEGLQPGDFLSAVLCNDLVGSFGAADTKNQKRMIGWASFLYNHMPSGSWGNIQKVNSWMNKIRKEVN